MNSEIPLNAAELLSFLDVQKLIRKGVKACGRSRG